MVITSSRETTRYPFRAMERYDCAFKASKAYELGFFATWRIAKALRQTSSPSKRFGAKDIGGKTSLLSVK